MTCREEDEDDDGEHHVKYDFTWLYCILTAISLTESLFY